MYRFAHFGGTRLSEAPKKWDLTIMAETTSPNGHTTESSENSVGQGRGILQQSPPFLRIATAPRSNVMIGRGYRDLIVGFGWALLQRGIASAIQGINLVGS